MSRYCGLVAFILFLAAGICLWPLPGLADGRAMELAVDSVPLIAETAKGRQSFQIEIANDSIRREQGLMFREKMDDDRGMLFVFEQTDDVGFWMKNTPLPLDLIFVGEDGRVRAVLAGIPFSEAIISPGVPVRFVLEVKAGIAGRAGIEKGDRLRHPAIDRIAGD